MGLQHQNIVRLVGYCYEIAHKVVEYKGKSVFAEVEEKALCFDYLRGGSLDKHIFDESCGLDWRARYKIIKGICEGLHYLHNGSKYPIYHLDLKPANILLDDTMEPKIGDFGLSRLFDSMQTCNTTRIIGTPGYMPPEYINRYKITSKFDVFSLGVVMIEVMTGCKGYSKFGDMPSQDFIYLVHENWRKRLATISSHTSHEIKTCIEIALRCVEVDRVKRPTIAEVVDILNKIESVERSLTDKVKLQSKQAFNQYTTSGAADAEWALTTSSNPPRNPRTEYWNKDTSSGTNEHEIKTLEQKVLEEDPSECGSSQDSESHDGLYWDDLAHTSSQDKELPVMQASYVSEDKDTSTGTNEHGNKIVEQKALEEEPSESGSSQDHSRQSDGRFQKLRSLWTGTWPTSKAKYEGRQGLCWWHDLGRCQHGDFSVAVMQANHLLEDQCFVESVPLLGTVIGVFDGHGGPEGSRFACDHLIPNLQEATSVSQGMTPDAIRKAFLATDQEFITLVSQQWEIRPSLAAVGSCCLVGIIHQMTLYVANLGDSRAVLGKVSHDGNISAEQLTREHNVNDEHHRNELIAQHPDDPNFVVLRHGMWRVKGIIQVSRSMGDAYLKHSKYNMEPLHPKFRISEPFREPILSADPSIVSRSLEPSDCFIIFASDGLWEQLSNQEAVEIVQKHHRAEGSARRLVEAAVREAGRKREMRYSHLLKIDRGVRRHFHDDITAVVLFLNHGMQFRRVRCPVP